MRIQFGTRIQSCKFVSHPDNSCIINASTGNELYTILFNTDTQACFAYKQLLEKGYYDASNNEYSNTKI